MMEKGRDLPKILRSNPNEIPLTRPQTYSANYKEKPPRTASGVNQIDPVWRKTFPILRASFPFITRGIYAGRRAFLSAP